MSDGADKHPEEGSRNKCDEISVSQSKPYVSDNQICGERKELTRIPELNATERLSESAESLEEPTVRKDKTEQKLAKKPERSAEITEGEYKKLKRRKSSAKSVESLEGSTKRLEKSKEITDGLKESAQKLKGTATENKELCSEQECGGNVDLMELTTIPTNRKKYNCTWDQHTLKITHNRGSTRCFLMFFLQLHTSK